MSMVYVTRNIEFQSWCMQGQIYIHASLRHQELKQGWACSSISRVKAAILLSPPVEKASETIQKHT